MILKGEMLSTRFVYCIGKRGVFVRVEVKKN